MTILLCLFEENHLPESHTEIYTKFIEQTINHHIRKDKTFHKGFQDEDSFKTSVKRNLAQVAYNALRKDKIAFTSEQCAQKLQNVDQSMGLDCRTLQCKQKDMDFQFYTFVNSRVPGSILYTIIT